jgi:hypothetical protein
MSFKHKTRERPFHTNKKSKQGVCVIETNNSPDSPFIEFDTCLETSCILVWILKQQPASTSNSSRYFIISNVPGYIQAVPCGPHRNSSVQVGCHSNGKCSMKVQCRSNAKNLLLTTYNMCLQVKCNDIHLA